MSQPRLAARRRPPVRRGLLSRETNTWPALSPDGQRVVFVRGGEELWLRGPDDRERRIVAHPGDTVADLRWTADGAVLLYRHTRRGRERWELSGVRLADLAALRVPAPGPVIEYWLAERDPGAVGFAARDGETRRAELFRVDLAGLSPVALAENPGYHRWLVDGELIPRGGIRLGSDGSVGLVLDGRPVLTMPAESAADLAVQRFSRDGRRLYVLTSVGAATRRLLAIDCRTGAADTVFEHPSLDVDSYPIAGDGAWFDPLTGLPDICAVMDQRLRHHALTATRRAAVERLAATPRRAPVLLDRSADDRVWLVVDVHDDAPIAYHLVDPVTGATRPLFVNRPELAGHRLARLEDFPVTAADGRRLGGYLMRPPAVEPPYPTVVLVHGGPADRDYWRFHADAQYLASLGYLSLHVNYRGSRGFGVAFRAAGNGEWGGAMQRDLYDAVSAGVAAGLVDPGRVAFFGASYGGYAALLAACTRPDLVRCAVAISPPCDLVSFTAAPPAYWQPLAALLRRQVLGDGLDEAELRRRSPLSTVGPGCAPLLIAHGRRDPRVPAAEVERFVAEARRVGVPVRALMFADEGHHIRSNANREVLFDRIEDFLEEHFHA